MAAYRVQKTLLGWIYFTDRCSDTVFFAVLGKEESQDLRDFYNLMIGANAGESSTVQDVFLTVERKKLTPEILQDFLKKAAKGGLTQYLIAFMVDLLKRCQSLSALTDYDELNKASEKQLSVDTVAKEFEEVDDFCEYRHKELLISLLETCPPKCHRRIVSLCAQAGCPCPFVYPRVNSAGAIEVRLVLEAYDDLFCLPEHPLVLSCGTSGTSRMGKTELLSLMLGFPSDPKDVSFLERYPGGPCHNLSIDIAFNGVLDSCLDTFVVADVHGFSVAESNFICGLTVLASGAALAIIHVVSQNFTDAGQPDDEVKEIVRRCSDDVEGRKCCIMIVWRDFRQEDADKFKAVQQTMPKVLTCLNSPRVVVRYCKIPDLRSLKRSRRRLARAVNDLTSEAVAMLKPKDGCSLPKMHSALQMATKRNSMCLGRQESVNGRNTTGEFHSIRSNMKNILDTAKERATSCQPSQTLFDYLFMASTLDSSLAALEEEGNKILRLKLLEGSKEIEEQFGAVEEKIEEANRKKSRCQASALVKYFTSLIAKNDVALIHEFDRQLILWKSPICTPLLEQRTNLHRRLEEKLMKLRDDSKATEEDIEVFKIHKEIQRNSAELDGFDISVDDVWSEVMSLSSKIIPQSADAITLLEKQCDVKPKVVHEVFQQCVLAGHPMQLLRGHPLYMAGDFLSAVLRRIQEQGSRKLFVVSVIGMQSSAKSTLLNYLFGCGFATRAGRCTKGLYASYMRTKDFDMLLLDSEGLMSVEGGNKEFDNEVTLMAMACSHVVIINQKGEIHRQLRELLEVALFAMKHLEILKLKPDIVFVLRDQADFDQQALKTQFVKMGQTLTEQAHKLKLQMSEFIDLSSESLHLFPSAFTVQERKGKKLKQPAGVFSDMILKLREQLFLMQESKSSGSQLSREFSTMEQWLVHARTVWTTIRKYGGNLVYYESMREIEQRTEVSATFDEVVASKIEAEGGFDSQCQALLKKFLDSSTKEQIANGSARAALQEQLSSLETRESAEIANELETRLKQSDCPTHFRLEFQAKLQRRIAEKKRSVLDAWGSHEARITGTFRSNALKNEMIDSMKKLFEGTGSSVERQSVLKTSFEREWKKKIGEVEKQMKESVMTDEVLKGRINALFIEQVTDQKEKDVYAQLSTNVKGIPSDESVMINDVDDKRWDDYLKVDRNFLVKKAIQLATDREQKARKSCISECKRTVLEHFADMTDYFSKSEWKLDNPFMRRLMAGTVAMLASLARKLAGIDSGLLKLDTPKFVNDVTDCLRVRVYNEYRSRRDKNLHSQLRSLEEQKDDIRETILRRLSGIETDYTKADDLVQDIRNSIDGWLESTATAFEVNIKPSLQGCLKDATQASVFAFDASFGSENETWTNIVEYCNNPTRFLHTIYEKQFDFNSQLHQKNEVLQIETTLREQIANLNTLVKFWGVGWKTTDTTTTQSLVDYCKKNGSWSSDSGSSRNALKIVDFVSTTVYEVTNPSVFATAYLKANQTHLNIEKLCQQASGILSEKVKKLKADIWDTGKGCPETCPLCGAKCSLETDHLPFRKHECVKHLFPAFRGWRNSNDNTPVFDVCTSQSARDSIYIYTSRSDAKCRSLTDHFRCYYPDWLVPNLDPSLDDALHQGRLRRGWVNTRRVFLKRYSGLEDNTSSDWIRLYEKSPLQ
jgi:hypothetical protein